MINDANVSSSFATWRAHDRHLRTSFFNAPLVLDVESRSHVKGFDQEWMASEILTFGKDQSFSPSDTCSFHGISGQNHTQTASNLPAHNSFQHYSPYVKPNTDSFRENACHILGLHCGDLGHRAGRCTAFTPRKTHMYFCLRMEGQQPHLNYDWQAGLCYVQHLWVLQRHKQPPAW